MSAPYYLDIVLPGQAPQHLELPPGSYIIGRGDNCRVRIVNPQVSERHALLTLLAEKALIKDLHSSNGTFVDSRPVLEEQPVTNLNIIGVGPAVIRVHREKPAAAPQTPPPSPAVHAPAAEVRIKPEALDPVPSADPRAIARREIKNQIHQELIKRLDLKRLTATNIDLEGLQNKARETIRTILDEVRRSGKLPSFVDPQRLETEIFNEAMRLGPLEDFLADESITEIMINGPQSVYVERKGKLILTEQTFMDDDSVAAIIERIVAPIGRRIDETQPYVDARLPDGSRVNAIIPPLSLIGPCLTIRKFSKRAYTAQDLVNFGSWSAAAVEFLKACVKMRKNIVVAGGTGSGKTTLLNVLSSFIPVTDRILTIEDAAELRLGQPHVVRLEARPPNIEGRGAITIRDLVKNSLRMRPDRIIVGEVRGGEALDMLQAMNTGHDGSLTTVHANSPRDVISRLETMVMMSGMDLPSKAIREQIASAVDIIVHQSRMSDGTRKVMCISEIVGQEGTQIAMQDIFEFRQTGIGQDGKVLGDFVPCGCVPTFFEDMQARGIELDPSIFDPSVVPS